MNSLRGLIAAVVLCAMLVGFFAPLCRAQDYALGPDDVLEMVVYGEEDLSGSYRVGTGGSISVPLIGEVQVSGLTLRAAEETITQKFSDGYLVDPSVSIQVSESRPVYIMGEVKNPGSFKYTSNMTVLNAVALAGGFTYRARESEVTITRSGEELDSAPEEPIQPGDVITVEERFF